MYVQPEHSLMKMSWQLTMYVKAPLIMSIGIIRLPVKKLAKFSIMHFSCRYYLGRRPRIVITDLDMLKQILVKDFDNFTDHTVSEQAHSVAQPIS